MLVRTLRTLALGGLLCLAGPEEDPALTPRTLLVRLRGVVADAARSGDPDLVARLRGVLEGLGDSSAEIERLQRSWDASLERARPDKFDRRALAKKLARELRPLRAHLETLDGEARDAFARCLLVLDSADPSARTQLGFVPDGDRWLTPEESEWKRGAGRIARFHADAQRLEFQIAHSDSAHPALSVVPGEHHRVSAHGVTIHSTLPPPVLERILRQALRAACFSNAILRGELALPPKIDEEFVFLATDAVLDDVLGEAVANDGVSPKERDETRSLNMRSFVDARGWRTSRWRTEADFEALVLWELMDALLGVGAQPCLRTGHLNWVCLDFLGTSMPFSAWMEHEDQAARTTSEADTQRMREGIWRAARQSLFGCRAFLERAVLEERDPPWARAMLDEDGKIRDEVLLKTTLVGEFLQVEGRLLQLCDATRNATARVEAFESALGEPLPEFEARWRRWLLPERGVGVLQSLEGDASVTAAAPEILAALERLRAVRAAALREPQPEMGTVELSAELSSMAREHARYLARHRDLWTRWPDMHEEYPDREGFSPAGALSGNRSVIAYGTSPSESIDLWMGTFYHRLPLLHPGLFGVGIAVEGDVAVLDSASLVVSPWQDHVVLWPPPDAVDVPRRFASEVPNPVPGRDLSELGYPLTIQLFLTGHQRELRLEARLTTESGAPVECYVLSPEAPLFVDLAPEHAWCLIPKTHLAKRTRYTAHATWTGGSADWTFTTGD